MLWPLIKPLNFDQQSATIYDMNYKDKKQVCTNLFNDYASNFDLEDENIKRKFTHSHNVARYAETIGSEVFENPDDVYVCYVIGLLHDIARFEQWTLYNSYKDTTEYNHAFRSAEILFDAGLIKFFPVDEKYYEVIKFAIANHGSLKIDESVKDEKMIKFAKMVRDADKLDILRQSMHQDMPSFADELPSEKISEGVLNTFYNGQCVNGKDCKSVMDRAIMQTALAFDLNFDISKRIYLDNEFYMASYLNYKNSLPKEKAEQLYDLALSMKSKMENSINENMQEDLT